MLEVTSDFQMEKLEECGLSFFNPHSTYKSNKQKILNTTRLLELGWFGDRIIFKKISLINMFYICGTESAEVMSILVVPTIW